MGKSWSIPPLYPEAGWHLSGDFGLVILMCTELLQLENKAPLLSWAVLNTGKGGAGNRVGEHETRDFPALSAPFLCLAVV